MARSLGFYGDAVSFQVVSGQSFRLSVLPCGTHISQQRWIPVQRVLGTWQDISSPPSSSLILLVRFLLAAHHSFIETSCRETTLASCNHCLATVGDFSQWFPNIKTV